MSQNDADAVVSTINEMPIRSASASLTIRKPPENREIYDGTTLNDVFEMVVEESSDVRELALTLYKTLTKDLDDPTEFALVGENIGKLLEVATKTTDNVVKMAQVAQRHVDKKENIEEVNIGLSVTERNELFEVMEKQGVGPSRMIMRSESRDDMKKEEMNDADFLELSDEEVATQVMEDDNEFLDNFPNAITQELKDPDENKPKPKRKAGRPKGSKNKPKG